LPGAGTPRVEIKKNLEEQRIFRNEDAGVATRDGEREKREDPNSKWGFFCQGDECGGEGTGVRIFKGG